jgi:hypothetical protein
MKRHETDTKQVRGAQGPSPEGSDSGTAVLKKTGEQSLEEVVRKATGTHSDDVAIRLIWQVTNARVWPKPTDEDFNLPDLSLISEMKPQNATEAMLAVQMIATHDAALMFARRATLDDQSPEGTDANVLRTTRLMRLFFQQAEAMQKLKRKADQQSLTVEQVNVHQGGQAIVGSVSTSKDGG